MTTSWMSFTWSHCSARKRANCTTASTWSSNCSTKRSTSYSSRKSSFNGLKQQRKKSKKAQKKSKARKNKRETRKIQGARVIPITTAKARTKSWSSTCSRYISTRWQSSKSICRAYLKKTYTTMRKRGTKVRQTTAKTKRANKSEAMRRKNDVDP